MTAQLQFPDPLVVSDGVTAYQRFLSLRKLYLAELKAGDSAPGAEERRRLLGYVQRLLDALEQADLFAQLSLELIEQVKGAQLDSSLQERLGTVPSAVSSRLSNRDPVGVGVEGLTAVRAIFADERARLPKEREALGAGDRPHRATGGADVSADAEFGAGVGLVAAGVGVGVAVLLAPKAAVGAVVVAGVTAGAIGAFASGALIGAGIGFAADALSQ